MKEFPLGRNGIKLEQGDNEIFFNDHGIQFGLGPEEILDLHKWMSTHVTIERTVTRRLILLSDEQE